MSSIATSLMIRCKLFTGQSLFGFPGQSAMVFPLITELRIFALIRLGITKSTQIAELLCLSNNTVYSYRSRVRSYAKEDSETFEAAVRTL